MKKSGLYRTCPECGSNLDPEERCDCSKGKGQMAAHRDATPSAGQPPAYRDILYKAFVRNSYR